MKTPAALPPVVLVVSAHDPSGAAGVQADIESINANGCRAVSVITALTAQNTHTFESLLPQSSVAFRRQAELLLDDIQVAACKIGMVGSAAIAAEIAAILDRLGRDMPVVLDPVLRTGTGADVAPGGIASVLLEHLVPRTTVLTPNVSEALALTGKADKSAAAAALLASGCGNVMVTGADAGGPRVINSLYAGDGRAEDYEWERLEGVYHGSGCTLAAAIAAQLARRRPLREAVSIAQQFTFDSLRRAHRLGRSQLHPNRCHRGPA